ncbi:MAG: ATP synthase F1 subunit delta [Clostridia bacterium]|nr:ATP synthase F1 subunit delta [Clostridia bacterium]
MSEITKEYGCALYDIAQELGEEEKYLSQIRQLDALLSAYPEYVRLLSVPNITVAERISMIDESFGGRCEEYICSFLKIMIERGYARELRGCFAEFEKLYYERHGILKAYVQSAVSLTDEQCEALREKLQSYSKKSVELSTKVVPSLIGGIRVELDGKLLEGSVRAGLDRLRSDIDKTIL